jgi:hypothetical protein
MKTWRKNRTQYARLFVVDGVSILGFLVGENNGVQNIETLKGEHKKISISKNGTNEVKSNDCVIEQLSWGTRTTLKDGTVYSTPKARI